MGWWQVAVPIIALLLSGCLIVLLNVWHRRLAYSDEFQVTGQPHSVEFTQPKHQDVRDVTPAQILAPIEAVRTELAAINEQVLATRDRVARLEETLPSPRKLSTVIKDQTREVEALLQLYAKIEPVEPMPPSGRWALNPHSLLGLFSLVRRERPRVVVELGSGTSTVWIGYALAANGDVGNARLISLDHDEAFAEQSRESVRLHADRTAATEVRFAPLRSVRLGDEEYQWYDPTALADVRDIDLLLIDGPPGSTGPLARYPALPLLEDRLSDDAVIVLDDAGRDDEKKIIDRWSQIPGLTREWSVVGRQAVFRYRREGAQRVATAEESW